MKKVKLPRLLSNRMQEQGRLHPEAASITFNLHAPHSARLTIPQGSEVPAFHSFVELYTAKGSAGVYRVNAFDGDVGSKTGVKLQHGLCVLADDAPVFTRNENGGLDEIEGTVSELLTRLWSMRGVDVTPGYWNLGTMAKTPVVKYQPRTDSLLQAVQTIIKKAHGYALSFDQSVFPWKLNVVQLSDSDPCEGRFSRNLDGVEIGMDDSDLVTRVYLDDRDGHTDADTISTWGVVSEILSVPENATDASVAAYVADYLEAHKTPTVTIECTCADLSGITGESIDSLDLGRMCRACLPDYNTTINERIVALDVPDVYGDPYGVRVSMSNKVETTADLLVLVENETRRLSSASTVNARRAGGAGAQAENNRLELIRSSTLIEDSRQRMRLAGIIIDGGIGQVKVLATEEVVNELGKTVSKAEAAIEVNADNISLKVSKDGVISAINQTAEEIRIQARKINLDGYVTSSMLSAELVSLNNAFADSFGTFNLSATNISCATLRVDGEGAQWHTSPEFVTKVSLKGTSSFAVKDTNGITHTIYAGYSISTSEDTISYLG